MHKLAVWLNQGDTLAAWSSPTALRPLFSALLCGLVEGTYPPYWWGNQKLFTQTHSHVICNIPYIHNYVQFRIVELEKCLAYFMYMA